ncbi:Hypothetical_protein [Hexamita inflata]|uniref:Hypothetical_protein n=1 Tax=Hexamita inflata TaxID=28002 RepID=A0AA86PPM4_9EUKA|nr:Hypothetical protein HINF_LOCUS28733 [Hexamita inflata]
MKDRQYWNIYLETNSPNLCSEEKFMTDFTLKLQNSMLQQYDNVEILSYLEFQSKHNGLAQNYCSNNATYFEIRITTNDKNDKIYDNIQSALNQALQTSSNLIASQIKAFILCPGAQTVQAFQTINYHLSKRLFWAVPLLFILCIFIAKLLQLVIISFVNMAFIISIVCAVSQLIKMFLPKYYSSFEFYFVLVYIVIQQFIFTARLGFEHGNSQRTHEYEMINKQKQFTEKMRIQQQTQIIQRAQQGMSIPTMQNINIQQQVADFQLEYVQTSLFDTFSNLLGQNLVAGLTGMIIFVSLTTTGQLQLTIVALSGFIASMVQFMVNSVTTVPLMVVFYKILYRIDQVSWGSQFKIEQCVRCLMEYQQKEQVKVDGRVSFSNMINSIVNEQKSIEDNNHTSDERQDFEQLIENKSSQKYYQEILSNMRLKPYLKYLKKIQKIVLRTENSKDALCTVMIIVCFTILFAFSVFVNVIWPETINNQAFLNQTAAQAIHGFSSNFVGGRTQPISLVISGQNLSTDVTYNQMNAKIHQIIEKSEIEFQDIPNLILNTKSIQCNFLVNGYYYNYTIIDNLKQLYQQYLNHEVSPNEQDLLLASMISYLDQTQKYKDQAILCYIYMNITQYSNDYHRVATFLNNVQQTADNFQKISITSYQQYLSANDKQITKFKWAFIGVFILLEYIALLLICKSPFRPMQPLLNGFILYYIASSALDILFYIINSGQATINPFVNYFVFLLSQLLTIQQDYQKLFHCYEELSTHIMYNYSNLEWITIICCVPFAFSWVQIPSQFAWAIMCVCFFQIYLGDYFSTLTLYVFDRFYFEYRRISKYDDEDQLLDQYPGYSDES